MSEPGDHYMMHRGMETGMGALPNLNANSDKPTHEQEPNTCWQLFNYAFSPHDDGIFTHSFLRIVVKMGI